jgi:prephenate dehydrogenase
VRTALVIGTGLIGTSVALALTGRGVVVHLADHDPEQARTAAALGAGTVEEPDGPVDLAVVAAPPAHVAGVLADAMRRGLARGYADVASVKGGPRRALEAQGLDLSSYIGTHPMSGREKSGPLAATADLFEGRPWVLTPTRDTDTEALNLVLELVSHCRAVPVVMDPDAHDRAVALVSHMPHLMSNLVAARLQHAEESAVRLCGQGIRDVTRIAASDPGMWIDILSANPGPVADLLAEVAADLEETVRALRSLQSADEAKREEGAAGIENLLRRGNAGQVRVPGKHGTAPRVYEVVAVLIDDQPGQLARIFADAGRAGVNIEDVRIEHATGRQEGLVQLWVEPQAAPVLTEALRERGWAIRQSGGETVR